MTKAQQHMAGDAGTGVARSRKRRTETGHKVVTFASGTKARAASPTCIAFQSLDAEPQWKDYMIPATPTKKDMATLPRMYTLICWSASVPTELA